MKERFFEEIIKDHFLHASNDFVPLDQLFSFLFFFFLKKISFDWFYN